MEKVILASQSPRRAELLRRMGIPFEIQVVPTTEDFSGFQSLDQALISVAQTKVKAVVDLRQKSSGSLILGADTIVVQEGVIFGKPKDKSEAFSILKKLSGRKHQVKTGFACWDEDLKKWIECGVEESTVQFRDLTDHEIWSYVNMGISMDKAGAYGIQDVGGQFISSIYGSVENVMGLPIQRLAPILWGFLISQNLKPIKLNMTTATTLVAVSKGQPLEKCVGAVRFAGVKILGENYVQEILEKQLAWPENLPVQWHLIGPLQKNKVKKIVGKVEMIHTVDRPDLAAEISKEALKHGAIQKCLIQVNIAEEPSKSGTTVDGAIKLFQSAYQWPGLRFCGLMCIPPPATGSWFSKLRGLRDQILSLPGHTGAPAVDLLSAGSEFHELSMGMSDDYIDAIKEGATFVRIGTAIFGPRT